MVDLTLVFDTLLDEISLKAGFTSFERDWEWKDIVGEIEVFL